MHYLKYFISFVAIQFLLIKFFKPMRVFSTFVFAMLIGISSALCANNSSQRKCIGFVEKARNGSPVLQNIEMGSFDFSIGCEDIEQDGVGSFYSLHTFSLIKGEQKVCEYNWRFLLKDKSGEYVEVSTGGEDIFVIHQVSNPEDYLVNVDGDLEGRIECDYLITGEKHSSLPFDILLELKPAIVSIDNMSVNYNDGYSYYLTFDVLYSGAERVYVNVEEEYDPAIRNYQFNEPCFAHIQTGNISRLYYSWVTVLAKNKYGEAHETLEFKPHYEENPNGGESGDVVAVTSEDANIEMYNIQGLLVFSGRNFELSHMRLESGIYIKKVADNYGHVKIEKIAIK